VVNVGVGHQVAEGTRVAEVQSLDEPPALDRAAAGGAETTAEVDHEVVEVLAGVRQAGLAERVGGCARRRVLAAVVLVGVVGQTRQVGELLGPRHAVVKE